MEWMAKESQTDPVHRFSHKFSVDFICCRVQMLEYMCFCHWKSTHNTNTQSSITLNCSSGEHTNWPSDGDHPSTHNNIQIFFSFGIDGGKTRVGRPKQTNGKELLYVLIPFDFDSILALDRCGLNIDAQFTRTERERIYTPMAAFAFAFVFQNMNDFSPTGWTMSATQLLQICMKFLRSRNLSAVE